MERTATVVFDGETLKPDGPIDMKPNTRYVIRYEAAVLLGGRRIGARARSIWDVFPRPSPAASRPRRTGPRSMIITSTAASQASRPAG